MDAWNSVSRPRTAEDVAISWSARAFAMAAACSGFASSAVRVMRVLSTAERASTRLKSASGVVLRSSFSMTASRLGRIVAIVA